MAFDGPAEDQIAIRALIDSYSDAVFRRDAQAWGATWAEDAVWNLAGTEVRGRDAIVGLWTQAMSGFPFVAFFAQIGQLAITGDHSTPSVMSGHSWHTVPLLLSSPYTRFGMSSTFGERSCVLGSLGKIPGPSLMGLMLAHAGRLAKYGA